MPGSKEKSATSLKVILLILLQRSSDDIGKYYPGLEISFVMGAEGAEWLERNNRQQEENTKLAIEKMELSPESVIADIEQAQAI